MSTWIFERGPRFWMALASAFALLAVSGCLSPVRDSRQVQRTALFQGGAIVASPAGYCIDESHVRRRDQGSFVLMAGCAHIGGEGPMVDPAVITVSVLPDEPGVRHATAEELAEKLSPNAAPLEMVNEEDLALVHLASGGDRAMPGGDPRHWRGSMVLNGHLTGLAVYAPRDSRLAGAAGRRLVTELADTLRNANPAAGLAEGGHADDARQSGSDQARDGPRGALGTFLSGLFGNSS